MKTRVIQLRGGTSSVTFFPKKVACKKAANLRREEEARKAAKAALEARLDHEAEVENAAMRQHNAIRPSIQKIGWMR